MPLAIDLFCGLGGWADGLLAEGYEVVGFDIERHEYLLPEIEHDEDGNKGTNQVEKRGWTQRCAVSLGLEGATAKPRTRLVRYPAQLVVQDVLTLHGRQFKDAALIVASPPCQEYSYMAMPWSRAKAIAAEYRNGKRDVADLTRLFNACFRIQREACEAAGRHIPLVVENVRGAIPWVGRSRWNFGSFHLWGDVPALMPITFKRAEKGVGPKWNAATQSGAHGMTRWTNPSEGYRDDIKNTGGSWFAVAHNTTSGKGRNPDGRKQPGGLRVNGKGDAWFQDGAARHGSKSSARKAASAMIAKIPLPLSRWIARAYRGACL